MGRNDRGFTTKTPPGDIVPRPQTQENSKEALNKSSFCGKRLEYMDFFRKNNLKSEVP